MKNEDDPFINRRRPIDYGERSSSSMWIAGAAALAVVLAIGAYAISTKPTNVTETKPTGSENAKHHRFAAKTIMKPDALASAGVGIANQA